MRQQDEVHEIERIHAEEQVRVYMQGIANASGAGCFGKIALAC